jgi:hypothetical protein
MDSRDLSEAQLDALFAKGSQDDELFTLVRAAHEALHRLAIRTHDLACDQVMRKPKGH